MRKIGHLPRGINRNPKEGLNRNLFDSLAVPIQQVIANNAPIEKVLQEVQQKYNAEVA